MRFQDRLDRFFFRGINKCTCINHKNVGISCVRRNLHPLLQHAPEHNLRIDQVFCATEANHADLGALLRRACRALLVLEMGLSKR